MFELYLMKIAKELIENKVLLSNLEDTEVKTLFENMNNYEKGLSINDKEVAIKDIVDSLVLKFGPVDALVRIDTFIKDLRNSRERFLKTRTHSDIWLLICASKTLYEQVEKVNVLNMVSHIYVTFGKFQDNTFNSNEFLDTILKESTNTHNLLNIPEVDLEQLDLFGRNTLSIEKYNSLVNFTNSKLEAVANLRTVLCSRFTRKEITEFSSMLIELLDTKEDTSYQIVKMVIIKVMSEVLKNPKKPSTKRHIMQMKIKGFR